MDWNNGKKQWGPQSEYVSVCVCDIVACEHNYSPKRTVHCGEDHFSFWSTVVQEPCV